MNQVSLRKAALWLGVVISIAYAYGVVGGFHFDDSHSVESNLAVRALSNIPSFWTDPRTSSFIPENRVYRPLVYTFYSLCWLVGQGRTWPFHLMKMLMHLGVCLGIFSIWRRLWEQEGWYPVKAVNAFRMRLPFVSHAFVLTPSWSAFFLALVFAVHPAGSECVDYISATTSLQCAMFYVWAYCFYLRWRDLGDRKWLAVSMVLYFFSVASKEEGITLPAMVAVTELFLLSGQTRARVVGALKRALPFCILGVVLAVWIFALHPESGNESRGYVTWDSYFMTQWRAYLWYMRLWFWPWDLNADYASMEFSKSLTDAAVIQAVIGNLLVIGFAGFNRRRFPAMLFGLFWFYITISPASSVIKLAEAINEHRMYLAYVGFAGGTFSILLFCAESFFAQERRAQRLGWIYGLVVLGLFAGVQTRNYVWADDENLWTDTVEKNPTSGRALNNLALVHLSRGQYQKSVELFDRCEQYWNSYMYCPLNRGIALQALGNAAEKDGRKEESIAFFGRAEAAYQRAYQLNPRSVHANFHLAQFYQDVRKDCEKAVALFRVSVEVTGGRYPAAEARIGSCYTTLNRPKEAVPVLAHALEVEPGNENVLFEKGRAEFESHDLPAASATYESLLKLNPRHLQGWYNFGVVLLALNDFNGARKAFEQTVALDPGSRQGLFNLSFVAEKLGDVRSAVEAMQKLVSLEPDKVDLKNRLAQLRKRSGATL